LRSCCGEKKTEVRKKKTSGGKNKKKKKMQKDARKREIKHQKIKNTRKGGGRKNTLVSGKGGPKPGSRDRRFDKRRKGGDYRDHYGIEGGGEGIYVAF